MRRGRKEARLCELCGKSRRIGLVYAPHSAGSHPYEGAMYVRVCDSHLRSEIEAGGFREALLRAAKEAEARKEAGASVEVA